MKFMNRFWQSKLLLLFHFSFKEICYLAFICVAVQSYCHVFKGGRLNSNWFSINGWNTLVRLYGFTQIISFGSYSIIVIFKEKMFCAYIAPVPGVQYSLFIVYISIVCLRFICFASYRFSLSFRFYYPTWYYIIVNGWTLWIVDTFSECEHKNKTNRSRTKQNEKKRKGINKEERTIWFVCVYVFFFSSFIKWMKFKRQRNCAILSTHRARIKENIYNEHIVLELYHTIDTQTHTHTRR